MTDYYHGQPGLRHQRRLQAPDATKRTSAASASSSTWCSTTPRSSIPGSRRRTTPPHRQRDWYVWSERRSRGARAGTRARSGYYYGLFWDQHARPELRQPGGDRGDAQTSARFWLEEMGVDGFRLDAIKHLIEDGRRTRTRRPRTPGSRTSTRSTRASTRRPSPSARSGAPRDIVAPATWATEWTCAFEFDLAEAMIAERAERPQPRYVERAQQTVHRQPIPPGQYATFLANHDQNRTRSRRLDDEQAKLAATLQLDFPRRAVHLLRRGDRHARHEAGREHPPADAVDGRRRLHDGHAVGDYYEDFATAQRRRRRTPTPDSLLSHYRALVAPAQRATRRCASATGCRSRPSTPRCTPRYAARPMNASWCSST